MSHVGPVLEVAEIEVKAGEEEAFAQAFATVKSLFAAAKGCGGALMYRSVEKPSRFRLVVRWDSVEAHTVDFRGSVAFTEWRRVAGPYFAEPPKVEHVYEV